LEQVTPILFDDAVRRPENPSQWLDFRLFMDTRVNRRMEVAKEVAAEISPRLRVGDSGAYAPGYLIGINHFTLARASRFCMSYWGLREDWMRSFLPDDAVPGVWLGYGWQRPSLVWEALFKQVHVIGWWGYLLHKKLVVHARLSAIDTDLTPGPHYAAIGKQQQEIRQGLGKLLLHARPLPPRVLVGYSQASAYLCEVLGHSYQDGSTAAPCFCRRAWMPCLPRPPGRTDKPSPAGAGCSPMLTWRRAMPTAGAWHRERLTTWWESPGAAGSTRRSCDRASRNRSPGLRRRRQPCASSTGGSPAPRAASRPTRARPGPGSPTAHRPSPAGWEPARPDPRCGSTRDCPGPARRGRMARPSPKTVPMT
jgi:hypothetical protein